MRLLSTLSVVALASTFALVACSDDDDAIPGAGGTGGGGKGGTAGAGGKGGTSNTGGKAGSGTGGATTAGTGGTSTGGTTAGTGGSTAGTAPVGGEAGEGGLGGEGGVAGEGGAGGSGGEALGGEGGMGGESSAYTCSDGCANLYVPFTGSEGDYAGTYFNFNFASTNLASATVTAKVRARGFTGTNGSVQLVAQDQAYSQTGYSSDNTKNFTALTDWTTLTLTLPAEGETVPLDPTKVIAIQLKVQVNTAAAGGIAPVNIEVDSVSISGNPRGPWPFTTDASDLVVNTYQPIADSTVTWIPGAP